jgi:hypothetical protein
MPIRYDLTVSDRVRPGPGRWLTEPQSPTGVSIVSRRARTGDRTLQHLGPGVVVADREHWPSIGSWPFGIAGVDEGNPGRQSASDLASHRAQPVKRIAKLASSAVFAASRCVVIETPGRSASRATVAGSSGARSDSDAMTPVQQPARQRPADRAGPEHRYAHFCDYATGGERPCSQAHRPECDGAVPDVVVAAPLRRPGDHRQHRGDPLQGLLIRG